MCSEHVGEVTKVSLLLHEKTFQYKFIVFLEAFVYHDVSAAALLSADESQ